MKNINTSNVFMHLLQELLKADFYSFLQAPGRAGNRRRTRSSSVVITLVARPRSVANLSDRDLPATRALRSARAIFEFTRFLASPKVDRRLRLLKSCGHKWGGNNRSSHRIDSILIGRMRLASA